jgi:hypothetical protein
LESWSSSPPTTLKKACSSRVQHRSLLFGGGRLTESQVVACQAPL